jgi:transposase
MTPRRTNRINKKGGLYLNPFQRQSLQNHLQTEKAPEYQLRLQIMLLADEGYSQADICKEVGCSPLTARHWMFVARAGQINDWKEQRIGRPKLVNDKYMERLGQLLYISPLEFGYKTSRWSGQILSQHLAAELGIEISARHVNRLISELAFRAGVDFPAQPHLKKQVTTIPLTPSRANIPLSDAS